MKSNVTEDNTGYEVRVIETDQAAVSATIHRLELFICIIFTISLIIAIWAFCIHVALYNSPMFHYLLMCLIGMCLILLGLFHFVGPLCLRKTDVLIGKDFIAGPEYINGICSFFMRLRGHKTIISYEDIVGVLLDISRGQISGASILGKGLAMISVRRIKKPLIVIETIRENTGSEVRWRKSPPRLKKLSMDDVDSLINETKKMYSDRIQQQTIDNL